MASIWSIVKANYTALNVVKDIKREIMRFDPHLHDVNMLDVALGRVPGYSHINKFGHNGAITTATDPEDVWTAGGIYPFYPTTPQSMEILSSSTDDDGDPVGDGAHTVAVHGLDANWLAIVEEVTLNGQTVVNLTNTFRRVYRAVVLEAGSNETNIGNITVRIQSGGTVAAYIEGDDGQTEQAIYTIPAGKSGFFVTGYVGISAGGNNVSNESAIFKWRIRDNNITTGAWRTQGQIECITRGSSWWHYEYGIPAGPLPEKTDIRIECTEVSATLGVVAGFDILLVDNITI